MNFTTLLLDITSDIATITLNRPDKLNALNENMLVDLSHAFTTLSEMPDLRCVIITGSGSKAFAAGADIAELQECDVDTGLGFALRGQSVFNTIENFHLPVIAAVNGFALGGGCELALACHIRYASQTAKFGQPEVKLGIIPGYGGTQRLTQLCGTAVATELICSGNIISAERALQLGLVNAVCEVDQLLESVRALAQQISSMAPLAIAAASRCIRHAAHVTDNGMAFEASEFSALCGTRDFKEGTSAFLEKRAAIFSAR